MKKILFCLLICMFLGINVAKADDVYVTGPDEVQSQINPETGEGEPVPNTGNEEETVGNTYKKIICGDTAVPYIAAQITSTVFDILKIATPVIIVIFGMLDLVKSVVAQKDDEIDAGKKKLLQRALIGASVFLVFVFVELLIGLIKPVNENVDMWNCVNCFINDECTFMK